MSITHLRLNHIALNVRNLEHSVEFYERLFGVSALPIGEADAARHAFLDLGYLLLELLESSNLPDSDGLMPGELGPSHLCFEVENIHTECERLGRMGIPITMGQAEFENLALGRIGYVFFRDPDGHDLQLAQTLKPRSRPVTAAR